MPGLCSFRRSDRNRAPLGSLLGHGNCDFQHAVPKFRLGLIGIHSFRKRNFPIELAIGALGTISCADVMFALAISVRRE